jgi:uncharacterized protein (TIGR03089 family)
VRLGAPTDDVAASVVGPAARTQPDQVVGQVVACSLRPLGGPFREPLPEGWLDFAREVPPQPDALISVVPVGLDQTALAVLTDLATHAALADQGAMTAGDLALGPGGRLITDANPTRPSGLAAALLAPVMVGASVVLVANCDSDRRAKISEQERVSTSFWLTG